MREDVRLLLALYHRLSPEWQEEFWQRIHQLICEVEAGNPPTGGDHVKSVSLR
jgi:hypothetical protein